MDPVYTTQCFVCKRHIKHVLRDWRTSVCLSLPSDGGQQVLARSLLRPDLPPNHGFLQPVHPAQRACRGAPHPYAGDAAAAWRAARGNECAGGKKKERGQQTRRFNTAIARSVRCNCHRIINGHLLSPSLPSLNLNPFFFSYCLKNNHLPHRAALNLLQLPLSSSSVVTGTLMEHLPLWFSWFKNNTISQSNSENENLEKHICCDCWYWLDVTLVNYSCLFIDCNKINFTTGAQSPLISGGGEVASSYISRLSSCS